MIHSWCKTGVVKVQREINEFKPKNDSSMLNLRGRVQTPKNFFSNFYPRCNPINIR